MSVCARDGYGAILRQRARQTKSRTYRAILVDGVVVEHDACVRELVDSRADDGVRGVGVGGEVAALGVLEAEVVESKIIDHEEDYMRRLTLGGSRRGREQRRRKQQGHLVHLTRNCFRFRDFKHGSNYRVLCRSISAKAES